MLGFEVRWLVGEAVEIGMAVVVDEVAEAALRGCCSSHGWRIRQCAHADGPDSLYSGLQILLRLCLDGSADPLWRWSCLPGTFVLNLPGLANHRCG